MTEHLNRVRAAAERRRELEANVLAELRARIAEADAAGIPRAQIARAAGYRRRASLYRFMGW